MLDIGFSELVLICVVGLIILGPQKLPVMTRTIGTLMGRAQRYVSDVKSDIQRQMELEELKKMKASVEEAGQSLQNGLQAVESSMQSFSSDFDAEFDAMANQNAANTFYKHGLHMGAKPRSWIQEQGDERIRSKLRGRLRRRYLVKKPRHE